MKQVERWLPDLAAGVAVAIIGLLEVVRSHALDRWVSLLVVIGVAIAVGLSRRLPGVALTVAWVTGFLHLLFGVEPMLTEVFFAAVAFGCARWGSLATVWLSGLSIPAASLIAVKWFSLWGLYDRLSRIGVGGVADNLYRAGGYGVRLTAVLVGFAVLATPWLLGLALRFAARSQDSQRSQVAAEAQRDQAEEIARLREGQAQLARDVHDVVGHSLAVILAQAESAQFLDDTDAAGLKRTMANIATSARTSLDDVRRVLASTALSGAAGGQGPQTDLDSLINGVRASGHEVVATEVGQPQPMPPELAVVAFRVLQEMLTNAIKHGPRDQPVHVERHWASPQEGGDLRIEVRNALPAAPAAPLASDETHPIAVPLPPPPPPPPPAAAGGQGIDGMRRRLAAVGGHFDVRRREDPPSFTATAWVPVRAR